MIEWRRKTLVAFMILISAEASSDQLNGKRLFYSHSERIEMRVRKEPEHAIQSAASDQTETVPFTLSYQGFIKREDKSRQFWQLSNNGKTHDFSLTSRATAAELKQKIPLNQFTRQGDKWVGKESRFKIFRTP